MFCPLAVIYFQAIIQLWAQAYQAFLFWGYNSTNNQASWTFCVSGGNLFNQLYPLLLAYIVIFSVVWNQICFQIYTVLHFSFVNMLNTFSSVQLILQIVGVKSYFLYNRICVFSCNFFTTKTVSGRSYFVFLSQWNWCKVSVNADILLFRLM